MPFPENPPLTDRLLAFYARRRWRGFLTLRRFLGRNSIEVRAAYGALVTLHPDDYIDRIVLEDGFYEPEVIEALRPFLKPDTVLWDIGANFGLHSLSFALLQPAARIHCFEPNPSIHARLAAHAERNRISLHCWPIALGDCDGTATLHINASGNPGMTTLNPWSEARYDSRAAVGIARADTLINLGRIPAPTLIKLDVEGSEPAVLTGLGDWLRHPGLRAVVFEAPASLLENPGQHETARRLLAAGFGLAPLRRNENHAHPLGNFLATRADS